MNAKAPNPRTLDAAAFARTGASLQGTLALQELPRLRDMLLPSEDAAAAQPVRWSARGWQQPTPGGGAPAVWLHLQAQAVAAMPCQRCLGSVAVELSVDRRYRFVTSEAQAEAEDADSDEDLLTLGAPLDVLALLEDELILAAPIAPRHDSGDSACLSAQSMQFEDAEFAAAQSEKPNPFAALGALKNGLKQR